ncbi:MAG: CRTAC1 family protein, partial [Planctomycetaceae bacterium]|nr:CRTAC1 family protein [Planctomycetaceae bacterium]
LWGRQEQDGEWSLICAAALDADYTNVIAVDLDADEREAPRAVKADLPGNPDCRRADMDLLLYGPAGILLLKNQLDQETGTRTLAPQQLDSDEKLAVSAVTVVDVDIDGDLDILAATGAGNIQQWSNKTDWTFALRTDSPANLPQDFVVKQFLPVDIDRDVDLDILVVAENGQCGMLENLRHGIVRYRDLTADEEPVQGSYLAISDWNGDATWDLFVLNSDSLQFLRGITTANGKLTFQRASTQKAQADKFQLADFDNDGHEDLLRHDDFAFLGPLEPIESTKPRTFVPLLMGTELNSTANVEIADIDTNGTLDLLTIDNGRVTLRRNTSQGTGNWFNLGLVADEYDPNNPAISSRRMNHYGIGSTVEVRAGNRFQARVVNGPHTHIGLGNIEQVDSVRIVWTNGIPQHHLTPPINALLCEAQIVLSSCPYLYVENSSGTHFVTDLLWAAPLGLPSPTGELVPSRPWEYIKIPGELLEPVDGKYRLHITEELREATYLDEVRLIAIDHPAEVEVFTNEKVGPPSVAEHKLHVTGNLRMPSGVTNQHGRDLLPEVASVDDVYAKPFDDQLAHGLTEPTVVEMKLGIDEQAGEHPQVKLFLTGWLHAPDAGVSAAIHEHISAGGTLLSIPQPLSLWVPNENGEWTEAIPFTGFVGGKTKTIVLDVSAVLNRDDPRIQLRSSMEFAWDRIAYSVNDPEVEVIQTPLELVAADLHYRGVSAVTPHSHNGPDHYSYDQVPFTPQVGTMQGHFTRFGDVLPLLQSSDNMLVVEGPGDELTLEFAALPAPPEGWARDFVIYSVGWDKDAQMHTVYGQSSEPLPFHEMSSYPYIESPPDTPEYREYLRTYQTRTLNNAEFRKALVP